VRSFWTAAEEQPDRLALILPDGREIRAGELAAQVNRLVHGLRARGVGEGSVVAVLQPNGAPLIEILLAAMQAGWHYTPINVNLRAGEVAHILRDSCADAFFGHARYAELCAAAADDARPAGCGSVRSAAVSIRLRQTSNGCSAGSALVPISVSLACCDRAATSK